MVFVQKEVGLAIVGTNLKSRCYFHLVRMNTVIWCRPAWDCVTFGSDLRKVDCASGSDMEHPVVVDVFWRKEFGSPHRIVAKPLVSYRVGL